MSRDEEVGLDGNRPACLHNGAGLTLRHYEKQSWLWNNSGLSRLAQLL
jgi:hypothetical protein